MALSAAKRQQLEPFPCFECGMASEFDHHVVPRLRGGTKTVRLCCECHGKAHSIKMASKVLTKEALDAKRLRGERVGNVLYGYELAKDGVTLIPNMVQQDAISLMLELRAKGESLRKIADELNYRNVPTQKGNPWIHTAVASILKRCSYNEQANF
jgi:hypothetical protein